MHDYKEESTKKTAYIFCTSQCLNFCSYRSQGTNRTAVKTFRNYMKLDANQPSEFSPITYLTLAHAVPLLF